MTSVSIQADASNAPSPTRAAAWVIGAGVVVAMHVGKVPVAIPVLKAQLGMSLVEAGILLSLSQFAGMLLAVFMGMLADAFGLRRSMLSGLLLMAVASSLGGASQSVAVLLLCRALEGVAVLLVVVPAPAMLRRLVTARYLALVLGIWGAFMPAGTAAAMLLGPWVIAAASWHVWWWALAAISLLCAWGLWVWVPPASAPAPEPSGLSQANRLMQTWTNPGSWWVALAFGMYSSQWLVLIGFFPSLLQEAGIGAALAGGVTALASLVNIAGNVAAGSMLHRGFAAPRILALAFVTMLASAMLVFGAGEAVAVGWRMAAALVFSMVGGLIPGSLFSLAVRLAPSDQAVSTSLGWTTQLSMMGQFVAPPVAAWLADTHGSWELTWLLNAAACVLGLWLVLRIRDLLNAASQIKA